MNLDDPRARKILLDAESKSTMDSLERFIFPKGRCLPDWKESVSGHLPAHFVFQGGGLLGIAHLGFFSVMEHVGVRAVGLAGTSAGAILALLVCSARGDQPQASVSKALVEILWRMPAASFIDGPYASRRLLKHYFGGGGPTLEMTAPFVGSIRRLLRSYGLNKGVEFEAWLDDIVRNEHGIGSIQKLNELLVSCGSSYGINASPGDMLRINATALPVSKSTPIPVGTKFTFPRDLELLAAKYQTGSPALMARASMAVPLFFDPLVCDLDSANWRKSVPGRFAHGMDREALRIIGQCSEVAFVDGGLLSNFPIDSFRTQHGATTGVTLATLSTIGVTLTSSVRTDDRRSRSGVPGFLTHLSSIVDGMRHSRDREAAQLATRLDSADLLSNVRIAPIDVGGHNWLNFQLNEDDKTDLFLRGMRGALEFLRSLPKETRHDR
ncbi:patatin-like phospholipase family protein [Pseudoxanthomonas mexicana]|uniref:Patatin-like phospholipase family protein n=1 Tax=Pseudoxanthomonas mexicana TaxID=128785 RepID=A0ABX6RAL9_PSEMX|nr:patatin-like phospholipase family protein [Pseudoxanthomonas mexicana]QND79584.1 patatin-like phospholipase family protein [Pseudoxanthomonas mexicana]WBX93143.1 patatin-like phospholipase family protein [Pseudoxanthomonas mexicana]